MIKVHKRVAKIQKVEVVDLYGIGNPTREHGKKLRQEKIKICRNSFPNKAIDQGNDLPE